MNCYDLHYQGLQSLLTVRLRVWISALCHCWPVTLSTHSARWLTMASLWPAHRRHLDPVLGLGKVIPAGSCDVSDEVQQTLTRMKPCSVYFGPRLVNIPLTFTFTLKLLSEVTIGIQSNRSRVMGLAQWPNGSDLGVEGSNRHRSVYLKH